MLNINESVTFWNKGFYNSHYNYYTIIILTLRVHKNLKGLRSWEFIASEQSMATIKCLIIPSRTGPLRDCAAFRAAFWANSATKPSTRPSSSSLIASLKDYCYLELLLRVYIEQGIVDNATTFQTERNLSQ